MKKGDLELDSDLDAYDIKFRKGKRGSVWFKGTGKWRKLPPGTDGYVLHTHGPGADPTWEPCAGGMLMATGTYVGIRNVPQDIVVGFTADFIQVSQAEPQTSGIIAHCTSDMLFIPNGTGAQFCIVISDLGASANPGIIPTLELTQPVANQFHVIGNLNEQNRLYYWVAFKKQP